MDAVTVTKSGPLFSPQAARVAEDALSEALRNGAEVTAERVRQRARVATGRLQAGIQVTGSGLEVTVSTGNVEHAQPVEMGRKPAYAPIKPLEQWVQNTLGLSGPEATAAAYRISHAQSQRGIKPKPFFAPGVQDADPEVSRILEAVPGQVAQELSE